MKKTILTIILSLAISGCSLGNKTEKINNTNAGQQPVTVWQTYRNDRLGFKIKYPDKVLSWGVECNIKENMVPVKIFEDDNNIYISTEYYYKLTKEKQCEKVFNTTTFLNNVKNYDYYPYYSTWKLVARDINNDAELDRFINDFYGQKCHLGEKTPTQQAGVYDITTKYDGKELGESDCFLNFMGEFKYFPKKNKAVAWNIGQEWVFWADPKYDISYDAEMADSFRFLE